MILTTIVIYENQHIFWLMKSGLNL